MKIATFQQLRVLTVALFAVLVAPAGTLAENITYTVDPTRSSLTISGTFAGNTLQPESGAPASLTTNYTGTITANRDFVADTLQLTGGNVTAQTNGTFSPLGVSYGLGFSSPPADYGFTSPSGVTTPPSTTFTGALLNLTFSPTSSTIDAPAHFNLSQLSAAIASGEVDYSYTGPGSVAGLLLLDGSLAFPSDVGSLADSAGIETLIFPIDSGLDVSLDGQALDLYFSGSIVATAEVPEPASLAVIAASLAVLIRRHRRGAR